MQKLRQLMFTSVEDTWRQELLPFGAETAAAKKKQRKNTYKGQSTILHHEHIMQVTLQPFFSPLFAVWMSRSVDAWLCRWTDIPSISCKGSAWGGETGAVRDLLKHVLHPHLTSECMKDVACPVEGVF